MPSSSGVLERRLPRSVPEKLMNRGAKRAIPRLPAVASGVDAWLILPEGARLQRLGHASLLVESAGVTALIDPVFGKAGPVVPRQVAAPRSVGDLREPDLVPLASIIVSSMTVDQAVSRTPVFDAGEGGWRYWRVRGRTMRDLQNERPQGERVQDERVQDERVQGETTTG